MASRKTAHRRRRVHSSKRRKNNIKSRKNGGRRKIIMRGGIKIDDDSVESYDGIFTDQNEIIDGKGKMKYTNGNTYKGQWKDGVKNGLGTMRYKNGDVYIGNWNDDKKDGRGRLDYITPEGTYLEGAWKDDQFVNGTRVDETSKDSNELYEYTGPFKDGYPHGKGRMITNNQIYTGDLNEGKAHGKGSLYNKRLNIVYVGDFKEGKKHGNGCIAPLKYKPDKDGTYLISECGIWENNKKHGNFRKVNIEVNRDNTRSEVTYELNYFNGNVTRSIELSRIHKPDISAAAG